MTSSLTLLNALTQRLHDNANLISNRLAQMTSMDSKDILAQLPQIMRIKKPSGVLEYSVFEKCEFNKASETLRINLLELIVIEHKKIVKIETFETFATSDNCSVKYEGVICIL